MDYGRCLTRFTQGQINRMWYYLENYRWKIVEEGEKQCGHCPPIEIDFQVPNTVYSPGEILSIDNQTQSNASYQWFVNNSLVSNETNLNYTIAEEGLQTIRLDAIYEDTDCVVWSLERTIMVRCLESPQLEINYPILRDSSPVSYTHLTLPTILRV